MTLQVSQKTLRRLFRMDLPELVFRSRQETLKVVDRIRLSHPTARYALDRERLDDFLENAPRRFFEGVLDTTVPRAVQNSNADESQSVLIAAHHASRGRFDLLGYKGLDFGNPTDWHFDPVSGRHAPFVHWSRLDALDGKSIGDSKVIWELNRHQWLVHLAQAWQLTGDDRYAQSVIQNILAWIRRNPNGMGINWASSLEVAFRLVAWCWALLLLRTSSALTPEIFHEIENAVEEHAIHIERYLSHYFSPNTHLTGEALGLFYAAVVFCRMKQAERWQSLAKRVLIREIEAQIVPDGIYFERSTCYQRYTADIYLHFVILAQRAGIELPPVVVERLRSALDALVALRLPNGSMPNIGDGDGGMVLPLSIPSPDDYRATFSTAAVFFRDPVYAWAAGRLASDTVWMMGTRAISLFEQIGQQPPMNGRCRVFPVGGFVVMRSNWSDKAHALIFDTGPLGCHFSAGHGHADLLSIQCAAFGEPFLVDAGTCCYTADRALRDYFRGTAAHSTVSIDGESQAEPAGPFSWRNPCAAQLLRWETHRSLMYADALHDAYRRLSDSVTHRRRVAFVDAHYWIVIDDLCGSKSHRVDVRFQFAPLQIQIGGDEWLRATRNSERGLLLRAFASAPVSLSIREGARDPMEGWFSSNYGCMEPAPAVVYTADSPLPVRIVTVLWPAANIEETPQIEVLNDENGRPTAVRSGDDTVVIDDDEIYVRHRRNH